MKQIRQLRQVLEEPVPGMDAVRIGAVQIAVHVQQRLVVQESCPDLRAERLEPLHGEMVEGRDEHLLLHLAAGHRIDHPLLQPLVEKEVVFQLQVQQPARLPAEVQQLIQRPDVLSCKRRRLPDADVQLQQLLIGMIPNEAGAIGGAVHSVVVDDHRNTVPGHVDVAFKAVCLCPVHGHLKGQRAVLRVLFAETAMGQDQRSFHLSVRFLSGGLPPQPRALQGRVRFICSIGAFV